MASNADTLAVNDFARMLRSFGQEIVRRPHGDATRWETITAILELDSQRSGMNTVDGGLEHGRKQQIIRTGMAEFAVDQEVNHDDTFEIDGGLWKVQGDAVGSDAGSKTFVIKQLDRIRGRASNLNMQP